MLYYKELAYVIVKIWLSKSKTTTLLQAVWKGRSLSWLGCNPLLAEAVIHRQSKNKTLNRIELDGHGQKLLSTVKFLLYLGDMSV